FHIQKSKHQCLRTWYISHEERQHRHTQYTPPPNISDTRRNLRLFDCRVREDRYGHPEDSCPALEFMRFYLKHFQTKSSCVINNLLSVVEDRYDVVFLGYLSPHLLLHHRIFPIIVCTSDEEPVYRNIVIPQPFSCFLGARAVSGCANDNIVFFGQIA